RGSAAPRPLARSRARRSTTPPPGWPARSAVRPIPRRGAASVLATTFAWLHDRQRPLRRTGDDGAVGVEARTMAGAVPGTGRAIPPHQAFHVGAHRRVDAEVPVFTAIHGAGTLWQRDDAAFAERHRRELLLVCTETITEQVARVVQVLAHVAPEPAMERLAFHPQQLAPGTLATQVGVAGHHRRQCAEGEAIARETRGDELARRLLADEGQAVVGLDHLAQPATRDFGTRQARLQP